MCLILDGYGVMGIF